MSSSLKIHLHRTRSVNSAAGVLRSNAVVALLRWQRKASWGEGRRIVRLPGVVVTPRGNDWEQTWPQIYFFSFRINIKSPWEHKVMCKGALIIGLAFGLLFARSLLVNWKILKRYIPYLAGIYQWPLWSSTEYYSLWGCFKYCIIVWRVRAFQHHWATATTCRTAFPFNNRSNQTSSWLSL